MFTANSQNEALRQASSLSRKLDYAYNNQNAEAFKPSMNTVEQPSQDATYTSPYDAIRGQTAQAAHVKPMETFEPDDPIPEVSADKKHRPHFVDFFMRKNGDNEGK